MEGFRVVTEERVIFRDLDVLGHVNNAVYASYFESGRIDYLHAVTGGTLKVVEVILAEITLTYKSPAFMGEELRIGTRMAEMRNSSFILEGQITEKKSGRLVATSRAVLVHYDYGNKKAMPLPREFREAVAAFEGREF